jgi:hypothetical protein
MVAPFGKPERQARADFFADGEELEFFAETAMVAAFRVLDALEILFEVLFREEGGTVDALELRILLIAEPVGAGDAHDLEGLDAPGRGDVRAAAEVDKLAVAVEGDFVAGLGKFLDEVDLHKVVADLEFLEAFLTRLVFADKLLVAGRDFGHAAFDQLQVFGRKGSGTPEVIEEACIGRRTVAELCFWKQLRHCGSHHVRGGVAQDLQRVGVFLGHQLEGDVFGQRRGQIDEALGVRVFGAIHLGLAALVAEAAADGGGFERANAGDHGGLRQARRDAFGDAQRSGTGRYFAHRSVGKLDLNRTHKNRLQVTGHG